MARYVLRPPEHPPWEDKDGRRLREPTTDEIVRYYEQKLAWEVEQRKRRQQALASKLPEIVGQPT